MNYGQLLIYPQLTCVPVTSLRTRLIDIDEAYLDIVKEVVVSKMPIQHARWLTTKQYALRLAAFAERVILHPTWAWANVQSFYYQKRETAAPFQASQISSVSLTEALSSVSSLSSESIRALLDDLPDPQQSSDSVLYGNPNASSELVALTFALCRVTKPSIVVETGVANGYTTSSILEALDRNGHGELWSIDLPHLHPDAERSIGSAVPTERRSRWKLFLGPADRTLRRVLRDRKDVDIFIQDASHTVPGQIAEFDAAWTHLKPGGIVVCDDVTAGFAAFAASNGIQPLYVYQNKQTPIGILVKPITSPKS